MPEQKGFGDFTEFSSYKDSVAIYLRKSRMDPDSESIDETLSRHEDTLLKLADKLGLNIAAVYKEVVSGDGLFTRPEMIRLLEDIERGSYSAVLCMEIDRLGRSSQKDGGIILEAFQENGVFIITPNKTYNLNDEIDEQSVEMQSFIARQELKSIKRRLRKGVEKTVESGYHVAEPPYGYRRAYEGKRPTLEIFEEEAAAVRMIFDMYVNKGMGSQSIADELNRMGFKPHRSGCFGRTTVQFLLQNPIYTGKIVWNRQKHIKKKSPSDKHRTIENPKEKWIIAEGAHEPIISEELFEAAERIRRKRAHPPSSARTLKNPLAGLIICGGCGGLMQRQASSGRLICPKKGCIRSVKSEYIENALLELIKEIMLENAGKAKLCAEDETKRRADLIRSYIRSAERGLKTLYAQKSRLRDLLESGVYDIPTYRERDALITKKIAAAEKELVKHQEQLQEIENNPEIADNTDISVLFNGWRFLSAAEKNMIYKQLVSRAVYRCGSRGFLTLEADFRV